MRIEQRWPLFSLRLNTPRLVLAPMTDSDLAELADLAAAGVHDPDRMPFGVPWTDGTPAEVARRVLMWGWKTRAETTPEHWSIPFGVSCGGELVGTQELSADHFALTATVRTGSWLGRRFQGTGIGVQMRAAVLMFAFDELGAVRAESAAFVDNPASLGVSRKLGYRTNGDQLVVRRPGEVGVNQRLLLEPGQFVRPDWVLEVTGAADCRAELGLAEVAAGQD